MVLRNPSFEEVERRVANPYGDLAADWGRWGNWINRETGWTPTHAGMCLLGYHHWRIEQSSSSGVFQDVTNIPPGTVCEMAVYARKDAGTNAEYVEVRLEKLGGFETLASRIYALTEISETAWSRLEVTGTNLTDGVRVLLQVKPLESGTRQGALKFDDATLVVKF